jgi:Tol biopolymer transport system component
MHTKEEPNEEPDDGLSDAISEEAESLFHQVMERPEGERDSFLKQYCGDNHSLYRQVTSLLSGFHAATSYEDIGPPIAYSSSLPRPHFSPGEKIGEYEIIASIGRGAMGDVYLCRHPRLGKKVALKLLPSHLASDTALIERFRLEARATDALEHPNILRVYDFHPQGCYIISEYVEGSTLRQQIGHLSTETAIHYAQQIGSALEAAHRAGIVHQDVKPENVMVRSDGIIKVLDFGLAKLIPPIFATGKSLHERLSIAADSVPGQVIGTIPYMSPERIQGDDIDHRTDIWSWGVVLHEMLSGKLPFSRSKAIDTLFAICNETPEPPSNNIALNRIVRRALEKSPSQRYTSMSEALADLSRAKLDGWKNPKLFPGALWLFLGRCGKYMAKQLPWVAAIVLVVAIIAWMILKPKEPRYQIAGIEPLNTSSGVVSIGISRDGQYLAFATEDAAGQVLRVRELKGTAERELVRATAGEYTGITFSAGDRYIYYVLTQHLYGKVYRISLLGGQPELIVNDVDSPISFAPDGKQFVFIRNDSQAHEISLVTRQLGSESEKRLLTLQYPNYFWLSPSWSSGGKYISCGIYTKSQSGEMNTQIMTIRVPDLQRRVVGPFAWFWMGKPIWVDNDQRLIVPASSNGSNRPQLMEVSLENGNAFPLTLGTIGYSQVSAGADSRELIANQIDRESTIWIIPVKHPEFARSIETVGSRFYGVAWVGINKIISQTEVSGRPDLLLVDFVSKESQNITKDDAVEEGPVATPDGKYLVYVSNRDGTFHLWRSNADGTNPMRLTSARAEEQEPTISQDGQSVVYASYETGIPTLWLVSINGGVPSPVTTSAAKQPVLASDGRIICLYSDDLGKKGWQVAILTRHSGGLQVEYLPDVPVDTPYIWAGKHILYVVNHDGVSNVWIKRLDGGGSRQLTYFKQDRIFSLAISKDGERLACIRGTQISSPVLLKLNR